MFNCGICKKPSKAKEGATRIVTGLRPRVYEQKGKKQKLRNPLSFQEITSELLACKSCGNDPKLAKKIGNTTLSVHLNS